MLKVLKVATILGLLVICGAIPALGAIGPSDYYITDHWFTIEMQKPYLAAQVWESNGEHVEYFQYYQNEQTFFQIGYEESDKFLEGGYLWESGWFVGANINDGRKQDAWSISPGYRFNLDNGGFMAVSANYSKQDGSESTATGLEFNGVFRPEKMKIETDAIFMRYSIMDENRSNSQIIGDISYQATDQLVIGGSAMYAKLSRDEMSVSRFGMGVGCTWDTDLAVVNAWVSDTNSGPCLYETGIFFKLSEGLRFGVEASKPSGIDTRMYYNLKYYEGPHRFLLGYDKMAEEWQIGYNLDI